MNDGGPVIFRHVGGSAATRPATKAGALRVYRGLVEVHEVENTAAAPSEFLRVELRTEGRDRHGVGSGMTAGQERWVNEGQSTMLTNRGRAAIDFLRFDFKTRPLAASSILDLPSAQLQRDDGLYLADVTLDHVAGPAGRGFWIQLDAAATTH